MHRNTTGAQLAALNGAVVGEIASGRYSAAMTALNNFPILRSSCVSGGVGLEDGPKSMGLSQFSGIFLVLAFGALVSTVVKVLLLLAPRVLAPGGLLRDLTEHAAHRFTVDGSIKLANNPAHGAAALGGSVADAMAEHAIALSALRDAAGALADRGAALEVALAAVAQAPAGGKAVVSWAGQDVFHEPADAA